MTTTRIPQVPVLVRWTALGAAGALVLAACGTAAADSADGGAQATRGTTTAVADTAPAGSLFDPSTVHTIAIEVDETALEAMIQTYLDSGDKEWISGTVTIDGERFEDVGLKLKGNSSLRSITTETPAQDLPWRVRLDKYTDGVALDGYSDLVIRASSTETSMNEAVALDLLREAGLATERAIATRVSVNGSPESLRLTLQNLDDAWVEDAFGESAEGSVLYKAEAEGDWTWRGDDEAAYTEAFDLEAGADDYAPLVDLLDLVNNSTDADFAEQLPQALDVDAFARYLAFQELIGNFDDIDGPGNNSYLYYDAATDMTTVVAWDHNLAFGTANVGGGGGPAGDGGMPGGAFPGGEVPGGDVPEGEVPPVPEGGFPEGVSPGAPGERPDRSAPEGGDTDAAAGAPTGERPEGTAQGEAEGADGRRGFGGAQENPLVERFLADDDLAALYDEALLDLQAELYDSGALDASVERWSEVLTEGAGDLVEADVVASEAEAIATFPDQRSERASAPTPEGTDVPALPNRDEDDDAATT